MNKQEQDKIIQELLNESKTGNELVDFVLPSMARGLVEESFPITCTHLKYRGFEFNCYISYESQAKDAIDEHHLVLSLSDQSKWQYANYLDHELGLGLDDAYEFFSFNPIEPFFHSSIKGLDHEKH